MDATISRLLPVVIDSFMKSYTIRSNDGEGSSSSSHQLLQMDTSHMDQLMAISKNNFEIKKMLQEMQNELKIVLQQQQLLQHQPLRPV
jgi:chemotaxis protein histidine kinase CheA